ncbi:hypothetical protein BSKO_02482 [Bryopsis sp. KO-2023]|nr:hypothetical protein BSKO_02482 [Bryopsis sp. KO-2023]
MVASSGIVRQGLWVALQSLVIFSVIAAECRPVEYDNFEIAENNGYTTIKLPGIDNFRHGVDYSTGTRKKGIFKFTYDNAKAGASEFLHYAPLEELIYQIPDQVDATNWRSVCSTFDSLKVTTHSTFRSRLQSESGSAQSELEQKTDIDVKIPVGSSEVSLSTQTHNDLGYGRSKASSDFAFAMMSGQRTVASVETFNPTWAVEWKSYGRNLRRLDPKNYLTDDFKGAADYLRGLCSKGTVDMAWRMEGNTGSGSSACERAAETLVEEFGTHFNARAEYGGKVSQSFFYNEGRMTDQQAKSMKKTSKFSMGHSFFIHNNQTARAREVIASMQSKNVVSEGMLTIAGGNPRASTADAWCDTVSKAPTIIGSSRLVPIADLIPQGSFARAAAVFAGMDRWVCNGRGKYLNISRNTGVGSCGCQSDSSFYLDAFCAPLSPKCYEGGKLAACHFEKLLARYTSTYDLVWQEIVDNPQRVALFKPLVAATKALAVTGHKALVGTIASYLYDSPDPVRPIITFDTSTSFAVARPATRYDMVCQSTLHGRSGGPYVYRPVCPAGYTSVSDFASISDSWPGGEYRGEPIRPCIVNRCLEQCFEDHVFSLNDVTLWRILGTNSEYGSDVGEMGSAAGFFRVMMKGWDSPPSPSLLMCLKAECVFDV